MTTTMPDFDPETHIACQFCDRKFRRPRRGPKSDHPERCSRCKLKIYRLQSENTAPELIAVARRALLRYELANAALGLKTKPLTNLVGVSATNRV